VIYYSNSYKLATTVTGSYSYVNTGGYHTYIFYSTGSITF
jgi:hypothetical protein